MSQGAATAFAFVLAMAAVLAAIVSRRSPAKTYVDIAAVLFAGFALAVAATRFAGPALADAAALLVLAAAPTALSLAVYAELVRPPARQTAFLALGATLFASTAAVLFATDAFAMLPLAANTIALLMLGVLHVAGRRREALLAIAAAFAFAAGASAFLRAGAPYLSLFAAAGLVGVALAVRSRARVEHDGWLRRALAVRGKR